MTQPATQQSPGEAREDHAAEVGAAVAALYAAAELAIITAMAAMVAKVIGGALLGTVARRRVDQVADVSLRSAATQAGQIIRREMGGEAPEVTASLTQAAMAAERDARSAFAGILASAENAITSRPTLLSGFGRAAEHRGQAFWRGARDRAADLLARSQAAQKALDALADRGLCGYVGLSGRRWNLASYAEMATRTGISNAHDQHLLNGITKAGVDLVLVCAAAGEVACTKCIPWVGVILSVTGATDGHVRVLDDGGFPFTGEVRGTVREAVGAGLRHPACQHFFLPVANGMFVPPADWFAKRVYSPEQYKARARRRTLERNVRAAERHAGVALTVQARREAHGKLRAARSELAGHRRASAHLPGRR